MSNRDFRDFRDFITDVWKEINNWETIKHKIPELKKEWQKIMQDYKL